MVTKEAKQAYLEQIRKKDIFKETMELKEFLEYAFLIIRPRMGNVKTSYQIWNNFSINKNSIPRIIEVANAVGVKNFEYKGEHFAVKDLGNKKIFSKAFPEKELNPLRKYRRKLLNTPEIFEDKYKEINKSINNKKESKYTLVVGAGISNSVGIPDWKKLVEDLASDFLTDKINKDLNKLVPIKDRASGAKPSNYTNLLVYARVISNFNEKKLLYNKEIDFKASIAKKIYLKTKFDIAGTTMEAVVKFIGGNKEKIDSIITYNYDDMLEYHLAQNDISSKAIYVNEDGRGVFEVYGNNLNEAINVYHVHGLIKISGIQGNSDCECYKAVKSNIILTELDYHKEYSALLGFNTQIQIEKFKNTNCIFLGISLTDPNLRRILDYADNLAVGTKFTKYWIEKNISGNLIFSHFDKINNLESRYKQLSSEFLKDEITELAAEEIIIKIKKFYNDYEMELNKIPDYWDIKNKDNSLEKLILKTIDCISFGIIPIYVENYERDNYYNCLENIIANKNSINTDCNNLKKVKR